MKRERSTTEALLSIVLGLEAVLIFFVAMTALGLDLLPAGAALGGGAALIVVLLVAGRLLRYPVGLWLGWALQALLIALGILMPVMYVIGAGFLALWIFCFVRGRGIDRLRVAASAATEGEK